MPFVFLHLASGSPNSLYLNRLYIIMKNQGSKTGKIMFSFFKSSEQTSTSKGHYPSNVDVSNRNDQPTFKSQKIKIDVNTLERDHGIRIPLWQHPINQQDEIRRAYIKMGPYQPKLTKYLRIELERQYRRFQYTYFDQFSWLEYSLSKDAVFCFSCFLFENKVSRHPTFTAKGFRSWKRISNRVRCALLMHVGSPTSPHNNVMKSAEDLIKISRYIDKVLNAKTVEEVQKNWL